MKYEIGDRLVVRNGFMQSGRLIKRGWEFDIVSIEDGNYGCEFDRPYYSEFHQCYNTTIKPRCGWWMCPNLVHEHAELINFRLSTPDWEVP